MSNELHKLCCTVDDSTRGRPRRGNYLERAREIIRVDPDSMKREAIVHRVGDGKCMPLHYACWFGNLDMVRLLIEEFSCDVDISTSRFNDTPLGSAIFRQHPTIVEYLLSKGANPNLPRTDGVTPLFCASDNPHSEESDKCFHLLIEANADYNAVDKQGMTPLHCAAIAGAEWAVQYLLCLGAEIRKDVEGRTPLDAALDLDIVNEDTTADSTFRIVQILMAAGTSQLNFPMLVIDSDIYTTVVLLLSWMRDIGVLDAALVYDFTPDSIKSIWTPLMLAIDADLPAIGAMLINRGIDYPASSDLYLLKTIASKVTECNLHSKSSLELPSDISEDAFYCLSCAIGFCDHGAKFAMENGIKHGASKWIRSVQSPFWSRHSKFFGTFKVGVWTLLLCLERSTRLDHAMKTMILTFLPLTCFGTDSVRSKSEIAKAVLDQWHHVLASPQVQFFAVELKKRNLLGRLNEFPKPAVENSVLHEIFMDAELEF